MTTEEVFNRIKSYKGDVEKYGINKIGFFGSYASNRMSVESDVDILIEFEEVKESFDNFMAVCDLLDNLFVNHKVEVVTKNGLSPYISSEILKNVIYV